MRNNGTNNSHVDNRWDQFLRRRGSAEMQEGFRELVFAIESGKITVPVAAAPQLVYAGGLNYCLNSDLKYSKMTAENAGILPSTAGDANLECWKFFRQQENANILTTSANALKSTGHSLFAANEGANAAIPIWDRVNGQLIFGGSTAPRWDVAINLNNNDIKPADSWYVSFLLGAMTTDLIPADLEMYCGIWQKSATSEGWITGGNFTLSYDIIGVKGTKNVKYLVIAQTDSGVTLYSQILDVPDAPDALDTANANPNNEISYPRIKYGSATGSGFVSFKIYRQDVAANSFYQIADIRNTNSILFDDKGGNNNMFPVRQFPASVNEHSQALAYSQRLTVGAFGGELIRNEFTLRIPSDYDWSSTSAFSQYLRFGFANATAADRQVRLDRIYLGHTYNDWSDSPFDSSGRIPSTSQTGGTPSGGGVILPPSGGSGGCVTVDTPFLTINFAGENEWKTFAELPKGEVLQIGANKPNLLIEKQPSETNVLLKLEFDNGSHLLATPKHGVFVNFAKTAKRQCRELKIGDKVLGWNGSSLEMTALLKKTPIAFKTAKKVGTIATTGDKSYICGFSKTGAGIVCPNRKPDPVEPIIV